MIKDKDRAKWFGASDTSIIMGNWDTKTFSLWWLEKCGIRTNNYLNIAMATGTYYEHKILSALGIKSMDKQVKIRKLRLRVNLDGNTKDTIYEVKTSRNFKLTKAYWQQAQVEMYATGKKLNIVAYTLKDEDYENYFNEIDLNRIQIIPIEYDENFIEEYLQKLKHLKYCLRKGIYPRKENV